MRPGPKPGIEACSMAMQVLQLVVQSDIICQEVTHLDKLPTADLLHQPVRDGGDKMRPDRGPGVKAL